MFDVLIHTLDRDKGKGKNTAIIVSEDNKQAIFVVGPRNFQTMLVSTSKPPLFLRGIFFSVFSQKREKGVVRHVVVCAKYVFNITSSHVPGRIPM